ncbi:MAG: DMT family transporter [Eubacteriales bacterium]|nr:DMT family transporter [Eubacteriales bacterium]
MEEKSKFQDKRIVFISALITMFLWGSAVPVTKLSFAALQMAPDEIFSRIYFAGIRFFIASFMVFVYLRIKGRSTPELRLSSLKRKDWRFLLIIGILRITLCYFFYYIALANISGVKGAVLVSSSTFVTVLITPFVVKEDKFNRGKLFALILGFAGIVVANIDKGFDLNFTWLGEGFMLISGIFTALVETLIKPKGKGIAAPIISWGQLLFGSIPLLAIGLIGLERQLVWNATAIALLIYSAMISAVAFILWYELLKVNDAGELAIYRLFIPIFGSILSALLIPGESFTIYIVFGLVLVVLGIIILNTVGRKTKSEISTEI